MFDSISYQKPTGAHQAMFKEEMGCPPVDRCRVRFNVMGALRKVLLLVLAIIFLMIDKTTDAHSLYLTGEGTYHGVEALKMGLLGIGMLILASFLRAQVSQKTKIHFLRRHQ